MRTVSPDSTDEVIANVWRMFHDQAVRFFEVPAVRQQLDRLAAELVQRRMMSGAEVLELVDVAALKAAFQSIDPG